MKDSEIFVYAILFVAITWLLHVLWEKRRTAALHLVAKKLGLDFEEKGSFSSIPDYESFPLLSQGHSKEVINRMSGVMTKEGPLLFGYKYTVGSGKNSSTHSQTVVWLKNNTVLPKFELRPENLFHKIGSIFGYADIDFSDRPLFSKRYLLRGENESDEISQLFSSLITDYFEENRGLCVESNGSGMLVYFNNRRLSASEIPVFYRQSKIIYDLFDSGGVSQGHSHFLGEKIAIKVRSIWIKILSIIVSVVAGLGILIWFQFAP